jgi:ATP-binding cassette subfamily F protein 3
MTKKCGSQATKPIHHFSGGEKARLALAKLVWQKPNLLLLDEPTNHLDLGMRAAIEIALQSYEGALILISHDRHLLRTTVDDFYLVYENQVQAFKGDLEDYHLWLQKREINKMDSQKANDNQYREKKSLQNRLKKLEQTIEKLTQGLNRIEATLTDLTLYEEGQQKRLQTLLDQQKALTTEMREAEEEWLEIVHTLEQ